MKKFLIKVALFLFPFFVYFVLIPIMEVAIRSSRISLELPKDKTILFTGDSHIERGVNEKFIPHAFNWAKSCDNYLNLYARTKKLLEANPQINTVFITATPRSLQENADWRIFNSDAEILIQRSIIFYELEELRDCEETIANILKNPTLQRKASWMSIQSGTFGKLEEFGGFLDLKDSSEKLWKEIENDSKFGKKRLSFGEKNCGNAMTIKYLRKIVELVRARGGKIIFLNPPIYHEGEFFDVPYYEAVLKEKFPDMEFWDYGDFPMPENCFYDIDHLNGKGAEIFSKELALRLNKEGIIIPSGILDQ